jgi:hypothetical protein
MLRSAGDAEIDRIGRPTVRRAWSRSRRDSRPGCWFACEFRAAEPTSPPSGPTQPHPLGPRDRTDDRPEPNHSTSRPQAPRFQTQRFQAPRLQTKRLQAQRLQAPQPQASPPAVASLSSPRLPTPPRHPAPPLPSPSHPLTLPLTRLPTPRNSIQNGAVGRRGSDNRTPFRIQSAPGDEIYAQG